MNQTRLLNDGSKGRGPKKLTYPNVLKLLSFGIVAIVLISAGPALAFDGEAGRVMLDESRWLPWTGCWQMVFESVDHREEIPEDNVLVCLSPHPDGLGVRITTLTQSERPFEETFVADGARYPVEEPGCLGWRSAEWSQDGHRLFMNSEVSCENNKRRVVSGISMLQRNGMWMDIQVIGSEGVRELVIREYRRADPDKGKEAGFEGFPFGKENVSAAWMEASRPLTVDDVIEARQKVNPVAVEAALMEGDSELVIDAEALIKLSDASVDREIIDLMVALSHPDRFTIGRTGYVSDGSERRVSGGGGGGAGLGGFGFFDGYYGPYAFNDRYAYWYPFYFAPFGYYGYSRMYTPYGGNYTILDPGEPVTDSHGKVIKGKGYSRVKPVTASSSGGRDGRGALTSGSGYSNRDGGSHGNVGSKGYSGSGRSTGRTAKPKNKN